MYYLSDRPESYWTSSESLRASIERAYLDSITVKHPIKTILNNPNGKELKKFRATLEGRYNASYVSNENLPELLDGQVEIARILLHNMEMDKWSIRARREGKLITYQVVDQYDTFYSCKPSESKDPLTFRQVISLLESIRSIDSPEERYTNPFRDFHLDMIKVPEDEVNFVGIISYFYPAVTDWYNDEAHEWLEKIKKRKLKQFKI